MIAPIGEELASRGHQVRSMFEKSAGIQLISKVNFPAALASLFSLLTLSYK